MDKRYIIAIGPESSGKSTLIRHLSDKYNRPFIPEYAREYLNNLDRDYKHSDLRVIAEQQQQQAQEANGNIVLCDTDLITLLVWQLSAFPEGEDILSPLLRHYDFSNRYYLLCYPDLDWVDDPLREHPRLVDREDIFRANIEILTIFGAQFTILKGVDESRYSLPAEVVSSLQHS